MTFSPRAARRSAKVLCAGLLASLVVAGCGKNVSGDTYPSNQETRTPQVVPSNTP